MEYLILGLLLLSPMTGYQLQQFIKKNLALICSHSAGSVQTALSKLEREGKILARETAEGRRRKKCFAVTEAGRAAFSDWVAQPMQAGKVKNMELSRLFLRVWLSRNSGSPPSGTISPRWNRQRKCCRPSGNIFCV